MMQPSVVRRGPWTHRLLVWTCTFTLGVLCFWLFGFVLDDIGTWSGPDYAQMERAALDQNLVSEAEAMEQRIAATGRSIEADRRRQQVLGNSTQEAQRTMSQLLDFQRLALEKGVTPSAEEQHALAESQRIFLENQQRYQELNQQIAQLEDQQDSLNNQQREMQARLTEARKPIRAEYERLSEQHRWKIATVKLSVMLPLFILAVTLFLKGRSSYYAPIIHAFGAAAAIRVALVMHEYFPAHYFKYILIGVALLVVLRVLIYLVRLVAFPRRDWLLRQYREAYERFLCPVCEYPIRRGPLKYLFWTRRSAERLRQLPAMESCDDSPYTCPMCGTLLYEECPACHRQRHALLPSCEHCGTVKSLDDLLSPAEVPGREAGAT